MQNKYIGSYFRDYLIQSEIDDFYNELKDIENFHLREMFRNNNKHLFTLPIHEAIIQPENIKIKSSLDDLDSLEREFKKLNVIFHLTNSSKDDLNAHYKHDSDEIHVYYSLKNTKLEIESMIVHEMIHRAQNKKSGKNYFDRAKKLTDELNKLAQEFNKTQDISIFDEYKKKRKFRDYDDYFEQMAYVYQTVKENPNLTPNQLVKYFEKYGFNIDYRLKKYIGMYWLIRDKI